MLDWKRYLEMCRTQRGQALRVWLPAGCAVALVAAFFWSLSRGPDVNFLVDDPPAHWIIYPTPPDLYAQADGKRRTVFRRKLDVLQPVDDVRLTVRALKEFTVTLNGVEVAKSDPSQSWKLPVSSNISRHVLSSGENELVASVTCERGPPALWLSLDLGPEVIASDELWKASILGSSVQRARLATSVAHFGRRTAPANAERPEEALDAEWPTCVTLAALAALAVVLLHLRSRRAGAAGRATARLVALLLIGVALTWLLMLVWNSRSLLFPVGYDCPFHVEYIEYISQHRALPLGNEGLEMGQAPLYYVLASTLTSLCRTSATSEAGLLLLRSFSFLVSFAQLLLLAACLRRLYPDRVGLRAVGVFFAACLPMQLYLMHYTSNDLLASALTTAAVYLALVMIQQPRTGGGSGAALGLLLGVAILTKLTVIPVVAVMLLVLAWQLLAERSDLRQWVVKLGVPATVCALVSGWLFIRNYLNFGQFFVPSADNVAGLGSWQDPGYVTMAQFLRFGQSVSEPFFSVFAGVPDGLYSTLWGDGGWGGMAERDTRPPWNYNLMAVGYVLALLPSVLIVLGWVAVLWQVLRRWEPAKLLLLGMPVASFCGALYFYFRYPIYGNIKAFYGLPSIASLCVFAAEGYFVATRGIAWRRLMLATALGVWGLTSVASFVVDPSSPETECWIARQLVAQGKSDVALERIQDALRRRPGDLRLHLAAGRLLKISGRPQEARAELSAVVQADLGNAEAQYHLAQVLGMLGQQEEKMFLLHSVIKLAPDDERAYVALTQTRLRAGHFLPAVGAARTGMRVSPADPRLHVLFAQAAAHLGETDAAIQHYTIALDFQPDSVQALSGLASIYAMHPDSRYRDAKQAVDLAERAADLAKRQSPSSLDVLAAAYAEAGSYSEAEQTLVAALKLARKKEQGPFLAQLNEHLDRVRSRQPLREPTFSRGGSRDQQD